MPKRFKFRLSRMIPTFQSCHTKDPINLPVDPIPFFLRLPSSSSRSSHHHHHIPTPSKTRASPSPAVVSVGCGGRLRSRPRSNSVAVVEEPVTPPTILKDHFKWDKEEKWHVVAIDMDRRHCGEETQQQAGRRSKLHISESDDEDVVFVPAVGRGKRRSCRRKRAGMTRGVVRWSTSDSGGGSFSEGSDGAEELDTLITNSTRSVSTTTTTATDSSTDFSPHLETIREGPPRPQPTPKARNSLRKRNNEISATRSTRGKKGSTGRRKPRVAAAAAPQRGEEEEELRPPRLSSRSSSSSTSSSCDHLGLGAPARLSMALQRLVPCGAAVAVEGKVRDSYAVAKRSEDPYEDFKVSMMEMIVEKEMVEERDLEELLRCFLSLNDKKHHGVILDAFSEIWADLFPKPPNGAVVLVAASSASR